MRTNFLRTPYFATMALLCFAGNSIAQTMPADAAAPPAKPTVETATTPVEQIKLNGRTLPLNIKTLAELQRLIEEKELREKLQETLKTGGAVQIPTSNLQTTPATNVTAAAVEQRTQASTPTRARPSVPNNTLMAVYGPESNLKAEVFVGNQQARQLKAGDLYGNYRVASISQNGIQLEPIRGGAGSRFVGLGQKLGN